MFGLTYAECQVEQSHPDVQSEEQNDIGHFAEQDDVSHVLLHRYWEKSKHVSCFCPNATKTLTLTRDYDDEQDDMPTAIECLLSRT